VVHFEVSMLGIVLDRSLTRSLGSQLCDQLRSRISSGELPGGARLPSSRELAKGLGISRTLVLEAFEQLEAEGYIEGKRGSGSFVRLGSALARRPAPAKAARRLVAASLPLPRAQPELPAGRARGLSPGPVDFRPGVPALDLFPREAWARALAEAARSLPSASLGYGEGAGLPRLREETAAYLFRSRGLRVGPEDVFVTSGCSQALGLISRALLRSGDALLRGTGGGARRRAVLENPCQPALSGLLQREGVELVAGVVDAEGLDARELPRDASAVAFVTPSHQYPLGSVLSAPRRAALIEWAQATDSIVVEDDFDGEYRYGGAPLMPLREADPSRVVYAGSFSKAFSPALRLGYAVVPPALQETWRSYRELMDIHSCAFTQAAMASMLRSGSFERHVRRMRKVYATRREALLSGLRPAFGASAEGSRSGIEVVGEAAGLHLALRFRGESFGSLSFDEKTVSRIASAGAIVYPCSRFAFAPLPGVERILLLGYGNLAEGEILRGLEAIASALAL
jgi:GntR family transcriptional regulator / MocR family aminotransferase